MVDGRFKKIVPKEILNELTPRVLAFWFMDDGAYAVSGIYLHTKGFEFKDVYRLAGVLNYKFNLDVTVQNHKNRPVIYIKSKSIPLFKSLIIPYMHTSMLYKFGL